MIVSLAIVLVKVLKIMPWVLLILAVVEPSVAEIPVLELEVEKVLPEIKKTYVPQAEIDALLKQEIRCFLQGLATTILGLWVVCWILVTVAPDQANVSMPTVVMGLMHCVERNIRMADKGSGDLCLELPLCEIPDVVQLSDLVDFGPLGWESLTRLVPL
jgi:hypothetical protein